MTDFLDEVLSPYQLVPQVRTSVKTHLVEANLWGMDSHGLQQIIGYVKSLQSGRINQKPQLCMNEARPTMIQIDGDRRPGQYAVPIILGNSGVVTPIVSSLNPATN